MIKQSQYEKNKKINGFLKSFPNSNKMQQGLRKFGSFMAGMIMPVIGLIIAWGFMTAILLGIKTALYPPGSLPPDVDISAEFSKRVFFMDQIIGFGIGSAIPLMIGFMGGRQIYGQKGAIIGVIATIGVMMGAFNPLFNDTMVAITGDVALLDSPPPAMILGAMITGPLAALIFKHIEKLWIERMPSGFEMLINNFSIGLIGLALMAASFWSIALFAAVLQAIFFLIINGINSSNTLFLLPIFVETEKILFLNNAVNHGILGPLGLDEVGRIGESAYFFLDPNPGTGMGLLIAYYLFGDKQNKSQSLAAMPIHFIGGIHEVYYPFVLTKPINLLWMIAGGMFASGMYQAFEVGGLFTPSPGSIIMNYAAVNPAEADNYIGLTVAIFGSMAITCSLTSATLVFERLQRNERVYFNPIIALKMSKISRLMEQKTAFTINKTQPIQNIKYSSYPTGKFYEWETITYDDNSREQFINDNENLKVIKFNYETEIIPNKNKSKKYLVRKFSNGKIKKVKLRSYDLIMVDIKYDKKEFIKQVRKITFKPIIDKKGIEHIPRPLIQQVWFENKKETMKDLIIKNNIVSYDSIDDGLKLILRNAKKIIFACEAGMGSSAMGAGIVRKLLKEENIKNLLVINSAIKDVPENAEIIITQKTFENIVKTNHPNSYVYLINQFLNMKEYEKLISQLQEERKN